MKAFNKLYRTDKLRITVRIKKHELCSMGCRLTIKEKTRFLPPYNYKRTVYIQFYNTKDRFENYEKELNKANVPVDTINEIMEDVRNNPPIKDFVIPKLLEEKFFSQFV